MLTITIIQVNEEYFPNQPIKVTIEALDELQHYTAELFRLTDSLISSTNVMTMLMQSRRGNSMNSPPPPTTEIGTTSGQVCYQYIDNF